MAGSSEGEHMRKLSLALLLLFFSSYAHADFSTPAAVTTSYTANDIHYFRSGSMVVSKGTTVVSLVPAWQRMYLFRATRGESWSDISPAYLGTYTGSGSLLLGKNDQVYCFYLYEDNVQMIKFGIDDTPGSPSTIYTNASVSEHHTGVYRSVCSTIDEDGTIYLFTYWNTGGYDEIRCLVSSNEGANWSLYTVATNASYNLYGMDATVLPDGSICCTYDLWAGDGIYFTRSTDHGATWSSQATVDTAGDNPNILAVGTDIYIFTQTTASPGPGVVYKKSTDSGAHWGTSTLVEGTAGYGDPDAALGSDGTRIYVLMRDYVSTGLHRERLVYSDDGTNWTSAWYYDSPAENVCTKGHINYQPYYNDGGPLEFVWGQYTDSGTYRRTFYSTNPDITTYKQGSTPSPAPPTLSNVTISNGSFR